MVSAILNDMPLEKEDEVSVMVNGLGGTPLEEQFIVYRRVYQILAGVENIMVKAESKVGEKTIVDSLYPGAVALVQYASDPERAVAEAAKAAAEGSEATKTMKAVHGRAVYSAERSIGILDGGSVVGRLIFKGIAEYYHSKKIESKSIWGVYSTKPHG